MSSKNFDKALNLIKQANRVGGNIKTTAARIEKQRLQYVNYLLKLEKLSESVKDFTEDELEALRQEVILLSSLRLSEVVRCPELDR